MIIIMYSNSNFYNLLLLLASLRAAARATCPEGRKEVGVDLAAVISYNAKYIKGYIK